MQLSYFVKHEKNSSKWKKNNKKIKGSSNELLELPRVIFNLLF
jgi:hypothetical protein